MMAVSSVAPSHNGTPRGSGLPGAGSEAPTTDLPGRGSASDVRVRSLVDAHYDFIWRLLRGLGVPSAGLDDATQHVFMIASQKIDLIEVGSERSFLFSTARGIALNLWRARTRSPELLDEDAMTNHVDDAPGPEQLASSAQAKQILGGILDSMDEDIRTVFVLFELEGLSTRDIGELLGLASGTVASRLRRAREEFASATKRFRAASGGVR
jgi:RNA polymerase sigma-70 factor, ECF subfamily